MVWLHAAVGENSNVKDGSAYRMECRYLDCSDADCIAVAHAAYRQLK
jgi:hypothetical protein